LKVSFEVAGMISRREMLAAVLDPFDWASDVTRREWNEEVLGIELAANAKSAADVVFHHANGCFRQAHVLRQDFPIRERHLGGAEDRQASHRYVPFGDKATRLHRHRGEALHAQAFTPAVGRRLDRAVTA